MAQQQQNKDLLDQIETLGRRLNVPVTTANLSNAQLSDLLTDLQRQAASAPASRTANKPNDQPSAAEQQQQQRPANTVAQGKSLITQRGLVDAGQEIRPEDVGGQEAFDRLIQNGTIVKNTDQTTAQPAQQQPAPSKS